MRGDTILGIVATLVGAFGVAATIFTDEPYLVALFAATSVLLAGITILVTDHHRRVERRDVPRPHRDETGLTASQRVAFVSEFGRDAEVEVIQREEDGTVTVFALEPCPNPAALVLDTHGRIKDRWIIEA